MKSLQLLCDLDNIVTDLYGQWLAEYEAIVADYDEPPLDRTKLTRSLAHMVANPGGLYALMNSEGFFASLKPLPGALDALEYLYSKGHEVKICTSPGRSPFAPSEKTAWVLNHLPFLNQNDIFILNNKWRIRGDVLLDDSPEKIDKWKRFNPEGLALGIAWPYNAEANYDVRAHGWQDTRKAWDRMIVAIEDRAAGRI